MGKKYKGKILGGFNRGRLCFTQVPPLIFYFIIKGIYKLIKGFHINNKGKIRRGRRGRRGRLKMVFVL